MRRSNHRHCWLATIAVLWAVGCSGDSAPPVLAIRSTADEGAELATSVERPVPEITPSPVESDFSKRAKGESLNAKGKVSLVYCYAPKELKWDNETVDYDLAKHVAYQLHANKIKVVDPDRVYAWLEKTSGWKKVSAIGAAFNADYVVHIDLLDYSLFEINSQNLYRGRADCVVNVMKMDDDKKAGNVIYTQSIKSNFPIRGPIDSSEMPHDEFKKRYLSFLSDEIGRLFYPVDETPPLIDAER